MIASLAGVVVFVGLGCWQAKISGRFGFLPAQGAYNLWAANQPGTSGRYYTQKLSLPAAVAEQNPARAESLLLFQRETGHPARDLDEANAHWRTRFVDHVMHHPLAWTRLLVRKTYALLNTWEQYNNETPAFHVARSPWLRWNPLSWGVLLVLGTAGAVRLFSSNRRAAQLLLIIAAATATSVVLVYVSARFRLPLVPLLTIPASVALAHPWFWANWSRRGQLALLAACAVAAAVSFSAFDDVRDTSTFVQDHALLARAAETTGDDALAWREAVAALQLRPDHPDALRIAVASYFNLLLADDARSDDEPLWARFAHRFVTMSGNDAADLRAAAGVALWRSGEHEAALGLWRGLGNDPAALAVRWLVNDPELTANAPALDHHSPSPLVPVAVGVQRGDARLRKVAERIFGTRHD